MHRKLERKSLLHDLSDRTGPDSPARPWVCDGVERVCPTRSDCQRCVFLLCNICPERRDTGAMSTRWWYVASLFHTQKHQYWLFSILILGNSGVNLSAWCCDLLAVEDPLVPPVDDTLVTPEARRRAEGASANATRELGVKDTHTHTHTHAAVSIKCAELQPARTRSDCRGRCPTLPCSVFTWPRYSSLSVKTAWHWGHVHSVGPAGWLPAPAGAGWLPGAG